VALNLIEAYTVSVNQVKIKFARTVKISSIIDSSFRVFTDSATPIEIISPFVDINTLTDYNQISRTITLTWDQILPENTDYVIVVSGLVDATGVSIPDESIYFTSPAVAATPSYITQEATGTVIQEILIEDYSVKPDIETSYQIIAKNPEFYIISTYPKIGEFYLSSSENNGRVIIEFNENPAANFLTNRFFKAQRKKIQKTPTRWEDLSVVISSNTSRKEVYVDFPSLDTEPVYNTPDTSYYESGYKYRIVISSQVGS
jgi:hypothetical protein